MKLFKRKLGKKQYAAIQRLAAGIECGAAIRPQAIGHFYDSSKDGQFTSCALGAAWECAMIDKHGAEVVTPNYLRDSMEDPYFSMNTIVEIYGFRTNVDMIETFIENRRLCGEFTHLSMIIVKLNDEWKWSREQIAQFLREIE